jgi:hypothetical protein
MDRGKGRSETCQYFLIYIVLVFKLHKHTLMTEKLMLKVKKK